MTHALLRALGFAARKHAGQTRKNAGKTPYLNHVIDVTAVLAIDGGVSDETLLVAAVLHDTVEDTETTLEELAGEFGAEVARLVGEMTDDKSLLKPERKRLQVVLAPSASAGAKQIKIADKICNVRDVADNPAAHWPMERRFDYLDWATAVVAGCRGINERLDAAFDAAVERARARLERESDR